MRCSASVWLLTRSPRYCHVITLSSGSAIFSQLPYLGVKTSSNLPGRPSNFVPDFNHQIFDLQKRLSFSERRFFFLQKLLNKALHLFSQPVIHAPDQFGRSCARVERVSLDERLNAARQVRHKIYKNALMPWQGLDLGCVIAKRPPLSDFALSPTRIFKIDKALVPQPCPSSGNPNDSTRTQSAQTPSPLQSEEYTREECVPWHVY